MPVVPTYEQPQARTQPLQVPMLPVSASPQTAFYLNQSFRATTQAIGQLAAKAKGQADFAAVQEGVADLGSFVSQRTYRDDDAAVRLEGRASFDLQPYLKEIDDRAQEIQKGFTNDDQRNAFRARYLVMRQSAELNYGRMESGARETYYENQWAARKVQATDTVMEAVRDPNEWAKHIALFQADIRQRGETRTESPEQIDVELRSWTSKAVRASITSLLDAGLVAEAKARFEISVKDPGDPEAEDLLLGDDETALRSLLQPRATALEADTMVDQAFEGFTPGERVTSDVQVAAEVVLEGIDDPEIKQRAVAEYNQRLGRYEALYRDRQQEAFNRGFEAMRQHGDVDKVSSEDWLLMDGQQRSALESMTPKATPKKNNMRVLFDRWFDPALTDEQRAEIDLRAEIMEFATDATFMKIAEQQRELVEFERDPTAAKPIATWRQVLIAHTKAYGGAMTDEDKGEMEIEFIDRLNAEPRDRASGQVPKERVVEIADEMFIDVARREWGRDTTLKYGLIDPTDPDWMPSDPSQDRSVEIYVPIDQIPEADATALGNYLKSKRLESDDESVEEAYYRWIRGELQDFDSWVGEAEAARGKAVAKEIVTELADAYEIRQPLESLHIPETDYARIEKFLQSKGRDPKREAVHELFINHRADRLRTLADEVIPEAQRQRFAQATGRPETEIPSFYRRYWELRNPEIGLSDEEARRVVGLPVRAGEGDLIGLAIAQHVLQIQAKEAERRAAGKAATDKMAREEEQRKAANPFQ